MIPTDAVMGKNMTFKMAIEPVDVDVAACPEPGRQVGESRSQAAGRGKTS